MKAIYFYYLALIGFFGLFALLMLWPTVLMPPTDFPVALRLLITVTPLLLPMRGMLDKQLKPCSWAAYISLIYFIHGTIEAYVSPDVRLYALLETAFSLLLFFGANFYVRGMKRH
jgi:uncharacterized membrane protein